MDKYLGEGTSRDEEEDLGVSDLASNQLERIYEMKKDISLINRQERNNRVRGFKLEERDDLRQATHCLSRRDGY